MSFTETRMPWFWGLFAGFAHFPKSLCNLYMYVFGFMFLNFILFNAELNHTISTLEEWSYNGAFVLPFLLILQHFNHEKYA
jgi:hypothetical protein